MKQSPTRYLAGLVADSSWGELPQPVIHEAKRAFLNWLGVAIGASRHEALGIAWHLVSEVGGQPNATVLGTIKKTDIMNAALLNGMSSHVYDFDDTHLRTIIHPTGPVAAAAFALAESRSVTGLEFLHSLILGIEVECRIGNAVYPNHYDIGWHITSTTGAFGAAAASAKLLGLDAPQLAKALGLAATQASGLREMFGTMTKPFHVGRAAQSGLLAAILASHGFTSSESAIEASRGFANVLSTHQDYREIFQPAVSYQLLHNSYKPFPCGIVIHPVIDACIQLSRQNHIDASRITSVELQVNRLVLELTGKQHPQTGLEGKFSVYHSAAVALIDGHVGEEQYSTRKVLDPGIVSLRSRVNATVQDNIREDEARVELLLDDGRKVGIHIDHAIGSLAKPMTDAELEAKFRTNTNEILNKDATDRLIQLCWALDTAARLTPISRASTP